MPPRPSPRRPDLKVVSSRAARRRARGRRCLDCSQLLRDNLGAVGDAVRFVASRNRLSSDMTEELNSRALLHLVDHDYAVLRQWRRECSLQTYLTTVIARVFLDLRNKEWGKAKPPAIARRLGAVALMLWRLTHRTRLSFDEAVKALQAEHGVTATRDELWAMYSKLPAPSGRYFVGVNELAEMEQPGADAEVLVHQIERRQLAARVERGLASALHGLADEDRLILKLFFHDGMFLAEIARLLNIDQPRLYPRFRGLMATPARGARTPGPVGGRRGGHCRRGRPGERQPAAGEHGKIWPCGAVCTRRRNACPPEPSWPEGILTDHIRDARGGPCPSDIVLASFVDGDLTTEARADIVKHVAACDDCREVVATAAAALLARPPAVAPWFRRPASSRAWRRAWPRRCCWC